MGRRVFHGALIVMTILHLSHALNILHWDYVDRTILLMSRDMMVNQTNISAMFLPGSLELLEGGVQDQIYLFLDWSAAQSLLPSFDLRVRSVDDSILVLDNVNQTSLSKDLFDNFTDGKNESWGYEDMKKDHVRIYKVKITSKMLGRTAILAKLEPKAMLNQSLHEHQISYLIAAQEVAVVRQEEVTSQAFVILITVMAAINALGRGYRTDFGQVRMFLSTHPTSVIVGVCTQLILMPLVSFTTCNIFESENKSFKLGLLILANTPGSSLSRFFLTHMDADTTLHSAINAVSGILTLGTAPGWIMLFGRYYMYEEDLQHFIKYLILCQTGNLAVYSIGMGLNQIANEKVNKFLKFLILGIQTCLVTAFLTYGLYCNSFWFEPSRSIVYAAAFLQSHLAQLIGISVAVIFKQPICRVKTISLATGMHNSILAMAIMRLVLGQPEADLSSMMAFAKLTTTNIFPLLCVLYYKSCALSTECRKYVGFNRQKHAAHHENDQIVTWINRRLSLRTIRLLKSSDPLPVTDYLSSV